MLKHASRELDSVQASLAFNRILDERRWLEMLAKGCTTPVAKALDVALDKEMELLAGYVANARLDADAIRYISERDPTLLAEVKSFKSKYGRSWSEESCKG
jgi:hypothetical protein